MMTNWEIMFNRNLDLSEDIHTYKYVCDRVDEFYNGMRKFGMDIYKNLISILEGSVNFVNIVNIQADSNA